MQFGRKRRSGTCHQVVERRGDVDVQRQFGQQAERMRIVEAVLGQLADLCLDELDVQLGEVVGIRRLLQGELGDHRQLSVAGERVPELVRPLAGELLRDREHAVAQLSTDHGHALALADAVAEDRPVALLEPELLGDGQVRRRPGTRRGRRRTPPPFPSRA